MPDWGTGIKSGISLWSANEGRKSAANSNDLAAAELQLEIERDKYNVKQVEQTNKWAKKDRKDFIGRRDRERGLLDPIQEGIVDRANKGPDFEGAAARSDADVSQSYGLQRDRQRRESQRYGVNPASGRRASEDRRFGNEEALAKVYGRNRSRLQEDDRDWARKIAALGTGNMRNASPNTNLSQLGVSGAAGVYGAQSLAAGQNSGAAFGLAGKLFADAADSWDSPQASSNPTNQSGGSNPNMAGDINYHDY
jgi:hypothetical protein